MQLFSSMKFWLIILILIITTQFATYSLYSCDNECQKLVENNLCDTKSTVHCLSESENEGKGTLCDCYNSSAHITVKCPWHAFINASFLYYQVKQGAMEGGRIDPISYDLVRKSHVLHLNRDFKPGFKVAVGAIYSHDNWYSTLEYTRLHLSHFNKSVADENHYINSAWIQNTDYFPESTEIHMLSAKWEPKIDIIDFILGRSYYTGKNLIFKPHLCLRVGWIDQKYRQKLSVLVFDQSIATTSPVVSAESNSWLLGPRIGLDTNWSFANGFYIVGNIIGGLLYQSSDNRYREDNLVNPEADLFADAVEHDHNFATPNFQVSMGLGWGTYFNDRRFHSDITIGYDFEIFLYQNQMKRLQNIAFGDFGWSRGSDDVGSLILHGLTVTAKLDF